MRVYLVRHGEAAASPGSPERSLTQRGRNETEKVARFMGRLGAWVEVIQHSGKLRARQTAEIFAEMIESEMGLIEVEGLMPDDETGTWARELGSTPDDIMLVGHLPFMSRLASKLLTGDETVELYNFRPSAALCLERTDEDTWQTLYFIAPDVL